MDRKIWYYSANEVQFENGKKVVKVKSDCRVMISHSKMLVAEVGRHHYSDHLKIKYGSGFRGVCARMRVFIRTSGSRPPSSR